MPKYPEFKSKPIKGLEEEDWGKITIGKLNIIEAALAKTNFLALKPELVHKLAKPFNSSYSMMTFEGDNQNQIRSAGNLINMNRIPRPEWFIGINNYQERYADIDWIQRSKKIDYQALGEKISKPVLQFDLQGNFIKEWDGATEASIAMSKPGSDGIGACCRRKQKTAYGFIWKFKS